MIRHIKAVIYSILTLSGAAGLFAWALNWGDMMIEGGATPATAGITTTVVVAAFLAAVGGLVSVMVYWTEYH